ncbi:hypothetical protein [Saccharopolyspora kobensis]|uniref:hypothetical protein n=1 Tax=Saccharopolyspora kobensis TaxID=146035 RepID=UPI001F47122E|nr:hypothetical protein [Saccharopolyspora kobensis]
MVDTGSSAAMSSGGCVLELQEIDRSQLAVVGGKAAHWGSFRGSKASTCHPDTA